MKRRDFIFGLSGATLYSNVARGQKISPIAQLSATKKRIAHVEPALSLERMKVVSEPYLDELKRLGYAEGENLVVERFSGNGRIEQYQSIAQDAVATKPDLILSIGALLTNRIKALTNTIPIVAATGDPIRFGIISNIARPGGNVTGVSVDAGVELWGKRLELLAEAVPKVARVAYISTRGNLSSAGGKATQDVAQKLGITLIPAQLNSPVNEAEYRRVFDTIKRDEIDAAIFSAEFEHIPHMLLFIELLRQARLPAMHIFLAAVEAGGLMSYAIDGDAVFRTMAMQTAEIFNGTNPGDLPYVQGVRFELAINLKTARELGFEFPTTLLARADKVIE